MGFLSFLKHGGKAAENVTEIGKTMIKGVGTWIDERKFTAEEAVKAGQKALETWVDIQKVLASENTVRSITRRYLAWGIIGVFLFLVLLAVAMFKIDKEFAGFILIIIKDTPLGYLVGGVGLIYFGLSWKRSK